MCYIAAMAALSAYDGSMLASVIGMTIIAYMLTAGLRTDSTIEPKPIYGE